MSIFQYSAFNAEYWKMLIMCSTIHAINWTLEIIEFVVATFSYRKHSGVVEDHWPLWRLWRFFLSGTWIFFGFVPPYSPYSYPIWERQRFLIFVTFRYLIPISLVPLYKLHFKSTKSKTGVLNQQTPPLRISHLTKCLVHLILIQFKPSIQFSEQIFLWYISE